MARAASLGPCCCEIPAVRLEIDQDSWEKAWKHPKQSARAWRKEPPVPVHHHIQTSGCGMWTLPCSVVRIGQRRMHGKQMGKAPVG